MKIVKGNGSVDIPNWLIVVGVIVVDNIVANICNTVGGVKSKSNDTE